MLKTDKIVLHKNRLVGVQTLRKEDVKVLETKYKIVNFATPEKIFKNNGKDCYGFGDTDDCSYEVSAMRLAMEIIEFLGYKADYVYYTPFKPLAIVFGGLQYVAFVAPRLTPEKLAECEKEYGKAEKKKWE